ncbi:helix-turn-helix domain-containing protein [Gracilibacillus alcaliphilus]|uniref:helix-turn-helix domain-containing protein n=1 Tax=Gracilibacillus alcaliphilus TaxID=1401441 RepID=UPI001958B819|nr:AraC family transcriptional regulator [Gracilibacillus alcaliphilus]MBM7679338.1 AraC-like DNA-binding protein [Gracilibacillus alcaliphilus]
MENHDKTVKDAILYIQAHLDQELSLHDLSAQAGYSPYHFVRLFKKQVGVSPIYFLSTLRLQRAKELLIQTSFPIREIGYEVGQQSLGTFTSRFTKSIGVSPSVFRASRDMTGKYIQQLQKLSHSDKESAAPMPHQLTGVIQTQEAFQGIIFVGLFQKPTPEGVPISGTLLTNTGPFQLDFIPIGTFYLMATALAWDESSPSILVPTETLRVRHPDPITINGQQQPESVNLRLHKPALTDPPILISLPLLMQHFLLRIKNESD